MIIASGFVETDNSVTEIKWSPIDVTLALPGDSTIVQAVVGKKIRVLSMFINTTVALSLALKSSAAITKIPGLTLAASIIHRFGGDLSNYVIETNVNEALIFNLSLAATVRGALNYIEVN